MTNFTILLVQRMMAIFNIGEIEIRHTFSSNQDVIFGTSMTLDFVVKVTILLTVVNQSCWDTLAKIRVRD